VVEDMTSSCRDPHSPQNDSNPRRRFYICVAIGCAILAMIAAAVGLAVGLSRKTSPPRPPDVVPGSAVPTFLNFCSDLVSRYQNHNSNMECSCDETTNTFQCKGEVDSNGYIQVKLQYNDATGGYSATDCECQDPTCLNPTPTCITLSFNGHTQLSSVDAPLQASCFVTDETLQGSPCSACQVCDSNTPFIQVNVEGCPNAGPSQLGCIQTHVINNKFLGGQPTLETTQPTEMPAPAPSLPPNSEPTEPLSECQALCQGQGLKGIPVSYSDTDDFKRAIISYMKDPLLSPHGSSINCWDVSQVSDMSGAFRFISPEWGGDIHDTELDDPILQTFNEDLNCWDTSSVTTMRLMFANATSFNGKIDNWDVSQVTDMGWMFAFASVFNGDLSSWQVGNVVYMEYMFAGAANFNAGIGDWDTSSVFDMQSMFELAANFNADISKWDTSGVLYMDYMFNQASRFNQPIGGWDTSRVIDMSLMFASAVTFSQDIGFWQVGK
jgi:surface protein